VEKKLRQSQYAPAHSERELKRLTRQAQAFEPFTLHDGVIETSTPPGQESGIEGLLQAAEARRLQSADEIVRSIFDSMDAFSGGVQTDDATVTVLRVI
jgi:hypothetical protein